MKTVAMIPIKLNNERLPGKNTKLLGGKPLIQYSIQALQAVPEIDEIYVFCSSDKICEYLPPGVSFIKRPESLDLPCANWTQVFGEFKKNVEADIYVSSHATAPFVSSKTISSGLNAVVSGNYDSAFCAVVLQDFFWMDGKPLNFDPSNIPRSQDLPPIYRETSGVYIFTKEVYEKYKKRIGANPLIMTLGYKESIDINTEEDFRLAQHLLNF